MTHRDAHPPRPDAPPASDEATGPLRRILTELDRIREESIRRDDEIWEAVEQLRGLVREAVSGADEDGEGPWDSLRYRWLKRRLDRMVRAALPEGSRIAVASRGDGELLEIAGYEAEHFPRALDGTWLGFYPRDGLAAVAHLEWVRAGGADYLLFPEPARWWTEEFPRLADHLDNRYRIAVDRKGVGVLYDLRLDRDEGSDGVARIGTLLDAWEESQGSAPSVLDWGTGRELGARLPGRGVFTPVRNEAPLPYLDASVDVVIVAGEDRAHLAEARRVARRSVVRLPASDEPAPDGRSRAPSGVRVEHLEDGPGALPPTSVVVPTYNGLAHLKPCVRALDATLPPGFRGEVLVVDDGSGPETARGLDRLAASRPWLRVVRNDENLGFIGSCNRGASEAEGEYLVFLNDDTVPLPGWIEALLRAFRLRDDAGAVGGRLIYPDGRLQEAGGVIFADGRGANFGRDDYEVEAPLYAYLRPVSYCSGALLATPRALFTELGGFDTRYRPAYFEDTDYCFAVRHEAGRGVYYQPEAAVVHVEGATSGTDPERGVKRHQVRNRETFRRKWGHVLHDAPSPPAGYTTATWHRLAALGGTP